MNTRENRSIAGEETAPETPLVSVVMASYNHGAFVRQAIESVLAQTYLSWELIIVDDGSSDGSLRTIREAAEREGRISVYTHPGNANKGLCETLKLGVSKVRGAYTAFLESDDLWDKTTLQKRIRALQKSGCGVAVNDVELLVMNGAASGWHQAYLDRLDRERAEGPAHGANRAGGRILHQQHAFLYENKVPSFSSAMLATSILRVCSLNAPVQRWLDWWLWSQASRLSGFIHVPEKLTIWRIHTDSYNYKINIRRYAEASSKMWKGFKTLASTNSTRYTLKDRIILALPFWCRICIRFCMLCRHGGFHSIMTAIKRGVSR